MKFCLLSLVSLTLLSLSFSKKKVLRPIIPLADYQLNDLPLLNFATMENLRPLRSKKIAEREQDNIKKLQRKLKKLTGNDRKSPLITLFASHILLHNYYLKTLAKSRTSNTINLERKLTNSRRSIINTAKRLEKLLKNKKTLARIKYHRHLARYFLADSQRAKVKIARELVTSKRLLPTNLQQKVTLVSALTRRQAKPLVNLQQSDNRYLSISASLAFANITRNKQQAFSALFEASSKATKLTKKQKQQFLAYSIKVWRKLSNNKQDWNLPPLRVETFRHLKETRSLIERSAISDWYHNKKDQAVEAYYLLAKDNIIKEYSKKLYHRYLYLAKLRYVEARNGQYYDEALRRLHRDHLAEQKAGNKQPLAGITLGYLQKQYVKFVIDELDRITPRSKNLEAFEFAKRLVITYPQTKIKIYEKLATTYEKVKNYQQSANTYMVLVKDTPYKEKYLQKASAAQGTYLRYGYQPNFNAKLEIPARQLNDYIVLRNMYRQLDIVQTKLDWRVRSHFGLLLIATGKEATAASIWQDAVVSDSNHVYAKSASAHLLEWYEAEQRWLSLEKISRLLVKRQVKVPTKQPIPTFLAKALLNLGIAAQQKGQHKVAIARFEEYKTFKGAPNMDFVTYQLSRLYKTTKQYRQFFDMLIDYVVNYPKAKHYRQALLEGGRYANMMAEEDHTIYFYQKFLQHFADSKEEIAVRTKLVAIYTAKGNYYDAIQQLVQLHRSHRLKNKQKVSIAQQIVNLEFKHGNIKNAHDKINWLIVNPTTADKDRALAYYYKVSLLIGQRAFDKISNSDYNRLLSLEKEIFAVQRKARGKRHYNRPIGLITLVKAERIPVPTVTENEVLRSANIENFLRSRFNNFKSAKANYLTICKLNQNSVCVRALHELARFSGKYLAEIKKIKIADTLQHKRVADFKREKTAMVTNINNTINYAHKKSQQLVKEGRATPLVADQVTWLIKNTFDFSN